VTTVAQQADLFIEGLSNRRRKAKPATIKSYGSYLRNWIVPVLGAYELGAIGNREAKVFVTHLVDQHLAAATVSGALTTLKLLVASELNENGDRLWHPDWNTDFIDAPPVDPKEQNAPVMRPSGRPPATTPYTTPYKLAAGSAWGKCWHSGGGWTMGSGRFWISKKVLFLCDRRYIIGLNSPRRASLARAKLISALRW